MRRTQIDNDAADAAADAMAAMVRAVAEGREDPQRLADALNAAYAETESLAQQLGDDTFVTDDVARAWREEGLQALESLRGGIYGMYVGLENQDADALLKHLEPATQAMRSLRDLFDRARQSQAWVRESMEASQRVPCIRCGHRNMPGRSTCEQCRFQLPNVGLERVETDLVGGSESASQSAFVNGLYRVIEGLEQPGGMQAAHDFVENLERLHTLAARQLDSLTARADRRYDAVQYTIEIRHRVEEVRGMLEAVRLSLQAGDASPLYELPPWLAEQFDAMVELKAAVAEVTGA